MREEVSLFSHYTWARWLSSGMNGASEPSCESFRLFATVGSGPLADTHMNTVLWVSQVKEKWQNAINEETTQLVSNPSKTAPVLENFVFKQNEPSDCFPTGNFYSQWHKNKSPPTWTDFVTVCQGLDCGYRRFFGKESMTRGNCLKCISFVCHNTTYTDDHRRCQHVSDIREDVPVYIWFNWVSYFLLTKTFSSMSAVFPKL